MVLRLGESRIRVISIQEIDNCKNADYPLRLLFKIPDEAITIERAEVVWNLEKFRAYTATSAAESAHTHGIPALTVSAATSSAGGSGIVASSGNTVIPAKTCDKNTWVDLWTPTLPAGDIAGGLFYCAIQGADESAAYNFRIYDVTDDEYYPDPIGIYFRCEATYAQGDALIHVPANMNGHQIKFQIYQTSVTDTVITIGVYYWTFGEHSHTVTGQTTSADTSEAGSSHTHGMTYDIYEQAFSNPSISIKIDGTDRTAALGGPWVSNGKILNVTPYITQPGWHHVDIIPNQLIRIIGGVFCRIIIGFAGEIAKQYGMYNLSFYGRCVYT